MRQLCPNPAIHVDFEDLEAALNFLCIENFISIWRYRWILGIGTCFFNELLETGAVAIHSEDRLLLPSKRCADPHPRWGVADACSQ